MYHMGEVQEGTVYSDLGHNKLERNQLRRISTETLVEATTILTTQGFQCFAGSRSQ